MPTRPTTPDPSGTSDADRSNPFAGLGAGLGAGLDFFQDWIKAAGSALPHMQGHSSPGMSSWTMPTLDPQELDKRIQDLKTVQFWLEQNARMIAMSIQGLEVQKMTLNTLKGMNVSMDALRDSLKARTAAAAPAPEPEPDPAPAATPSHADDATTPNGAGPDAAADLINPMRWWDTLTQQFTHLASQASQTAQSVGESVGSSMGDIMAKAAAQTGAAPRSTKPRAAASKKTAAKKAVRKRSTPPKA